MGAHQLKMRTFKPRGLSALLGLTMLLSLTLAARADDVHPADTLAPSYALPLHDRFIIRVAYTLESTNEALIYARPTAPTEGGEHHQPLPISAGQGVYETWLSYDEPTRLSEVLVYMVDRRTRKVLATTKLPLAVTWGTPEEFKLQLEYKFVWSQFRSASQAVEFSNFDRAKKMLDAFLDQPAPSRPESLTLEAELTRATVCSLSGLWDEAEQQGQALTQRLEPASSASLFPHETLWRNARLVLKNQQFDIFWNQGRLGECRLLLPSMIRESDELQRQLAGLTNGKWWTRLYTRELYAPWLTRYNAGRLLASTGQRDQAIPVFQELIADITRNWCEHRASRLNKGTLFEVTTTLAEWFLEAGQVTEARAMLNKDICFHYSSIEKSFKALQDLWGGRMDALDGKPVTLERMKKAIQTTDQYGPTAHKIAARYSYLRLLIILQQWEEASGLADEYVAMARQEKFHLQLVHLLQARAEIHLERGQLAEAEQDIREALLLARAAAYKMAEPGLYRLCAELNRRQGRASEARNLLAQAADLAGRFQQSWVESACADDRQQLDPEADPNAQTEPGGVSGVGWGKEEIILFPQRVNTRVETGEYARAQFHLVNPAPQAQTGTLQLTSQTLQADWSVDGPLVSLQLHHPTAGPFTSERKLALPPYSTMILTFERILEANTGPEEVEIRWDGAHAQTVLWESGPDVTQRTLALVDASELTANPFAHVPFRNEFYYRGQTLIHSDLKMHASAPCRLEVYDAHSEKLLAVDATGNGRFTEAGDAVHVDANENGWPDLTFGPDADAQAIHLWVYPLANQPEPVEIALSLGDGTTWVLQGMDVLSPRPATPERSAP